ncbi:unnamed protein product, partial [marine sediment metagenome]
LNDLQKVKMWAWEGDPISAGTFKNFGISPIPLPITDVLTSLQTNLIDTVYTGALACVSLQWFTKVKYILDLKLTYATGAVLVSKKIFNRLKPEHQETVKKLANEHFRKLVVQSRKDDETSLQLMLESGLDLVPINAEEMKKMQEASTKTRSSLAGSLYSPELLKKVEMELEVFRKK